jgi:hypothetical protein
VSVRVELRIERLVLDGIVAEAVSLAAVERALQAELGRLVAARGLPAGLLDGRAIGGAQSAALGPGTVGGASLGSALGGAVYRGMGA